MKNKKIIAVIFIIWLHILLSPIALATTTDTELTNEEDDLTTTQENIPTKNSESEEIDVLEDSYPSLETSNESEEGNISRQSRAFIDSEWTRVTSPVTNDFSLGGISYSVTTDLTTPLFANKIVNNATNESHTYSYSHGDAITSHLFINVIEISPSYVDFYTKIDTDGQNLIAGVATIDNLQIVEVLKPTKDGKLLHTLTVTNVGGFSNDLHDVNLVIGLDTMLDFDDNIPIISDGNNGSYITNDDITLWSEPLNNLSQFVGDFRDFYDITKYTPSFGASLGDVLVYSVDTAIAYQTPTYDYSAPGSSYSFSWQERLYTDGTNPLTEYQVTFESNGGSTVIDQTVKDSQLAILPEVPSRPGYTFNGWYTDPELTTEYDFNTPVTKDMTLYAKWDKLDGGDQIDDNTTNNGTEKANNYTQSTVLGKTLPKTGDNHSYSLILFGSIILVLSIYVVNLKRKKFS